MNEKRILNEKKIQDAAPQACVKRTDKKIESFESQVAGPRFRGQKSRMMSRCSELLYNYRLATLTNRTTPVALIVVNYLVSQFVVRNIDFFLGYSNFFCSKPKHLTIADRSRRPKKVGERLQFRRNHRFHHGGP